MQQLTKDFEKLLNDLPIDDANRAQSQNHIENIIKEEIKEAKSTGNINTTKDNLTLRIKDAALSSIKERVSRWVQLRNDVILRSKQIDLQASASEADIKERELVEEAEEAKSQAREEYMRNNHYNDIQSEYELTKELYEGIRGEMGGKPPVKRKLFLYLFSITMIGFVEWFINYSTFEMKYPAGVAFGATILIAISVALGSHFHGELLKQRVALFAAHRAKKDKNQVLLKQFIFSFLFLIALGVVTYNRYDILQSTLVNTGGPMLPGSETENAQSQVWNELLPFVLMNVLVWLVGVAISYFIHDSRPDYQEAHVHYEKAKKRFFSVDKGLKAEENRIDAEFNDKIKRLKNSKAVGSQKQDKVISFIERLKSKEEAILIQATTNINEVLERHQAMLVSSLRQNQLGNVYIGPRQLTLDDYLNTEVQMNALDIRTYLSMEN